MRICGQHQETIRQEYNFFFLKICLFAYFEAESLSVALVVLEFAMQTRLPFNSENCLSLPPKVCTIMLGFLFVCVCHMFSFTHRGQKRALDLQMNNSEQEFKKLNTLIQSKDILIGYMLRNEGGKYSKSLYATLREEALCLQCSHCGS